jgi:hypothetical protein
MKEATIRAAVYAYANSKPTDDGQQVQDRAGGVDGSPASNIKEERK